MTPAGPCVVALGAGVVKVVVDVALGVTAVEAGDATEAPLALVAVTVNVYAVPLVSPVIVAWVAPVVVANWPPGLAVTV